MVDIIDLLNSLDVVIDDNIEDDMDYIYEIDHDKWYLEV